MLAGLFLSLAVPALALPSQLTFNQPDLASVVDGVKDRLADTVDRLTHQGRVDSWTHDGVKTFDSVWHHSNEFKYELVTHDEFPSYQVRLLKNSICDPTVSSFSGYLDIDSDTHLFFWMFEARNSPKTAETVVWLNGGPGCSSTTGLLFENGPCLVTDKGQNTTWNPHSWNNDANMIFLDQPVQVGYSYGSKSINNSPDAARDVYAFLQLLSAKFPKLLKHGLHISGESYAGTYIPNMASVIAQYNKAPPTKQAVHLPLKSIIIGNGLTDAYLQFASMPEYACAPSKHAIFDEATCDGMRSKVATCQRLVQYCYNSPNRFTCVPATLQCWGVAGPIQSSGLNPYDIRRKCDREGEDGPLCYKELGWIETYLNKPEIKKALGADEGTTFESCNMKVNQAFSFNGDVSHNTAALLPPLLEDGLRVLIYVGEEDFLCNYVGNEAWTLDLPWSGQRAFASEKLARFTSGNRTAGSTRSHKGLTYLSIKDAGHMVPADQPEVSLDMLTRWLGKKSFEA